MKTSSLLLVASLSIGASISAQTKPCLAMNDATSNASRLITAKSSAGPGYWALQWSPKSTYVARAMTIFTGSRFLSGFHSLEVWTHNPSTKLPGVRLAGGTWYLPKVSPHAWYGTNLDKPQILRKGATYWIVWIEPGWSNLPHQVGGMPSLPLLHRNGPNGTWASIKPWGFKFRLYCKLRDRPSLRPVGQPCSGADRRLATSFANTLPQIGNAAFRIEGTGVPSGAVSLLILGANKAFQPVSLSPLAPGCFLNTDVLLFVIGKSGSGDQQSKPAIGAAHHVVFGIPIPASGGLKGTFLGTQIAVLDAKSTHQLPMVFTNGLQVTFQ